MPTFIVRHVTTYRYKAAVAFGDHRMMLRPRESSDQRTRSSRLKIVPEPVDTNWSEDPSGNLVGIARFGRRARELSFEACIEVEQTEIDLDAMRLADHARTCPFSYGAEEMPDLARFIERQYADPDHGLDRWVRGVLGEDPDRDTFRFLVRLNARIRSDFAYLRREAVGIQSPVHTLRLGSGTCRDFAVLMAEAARSVGIAARFVSGYLHVATDEPALVMAGGFTHAWLQVYLPGAGWIDFDPTSGSVGNRDLVRVAAVRDPAQAAPIGGSFLGFPSDFIAMSVAVSVVCKRSDSCAPGTISEERAA
jgi:transglutaminase-like putative cysteine protease